MDVPEHDSEWPKFEDVWLQQKTDQEILDELDKDASLFQINEEGESLLSLAAKLGRLSIVKELLRRGMRPDFCGWCPALCYAAREGNTDIARVLLEAGENPNSGGGDCDYALNNAIRSGNLETVKLLVAYGANPRLKGRKWDDQPALILAALYGHQAIYDFLLPLVPEQAEEALAEFDCLNIEPERREAVRAILLGADIPHTTDRIE